ncbi:DUF1540 domain-containing protein [Cellulomonas hominis]
MSTLMELPRITECSVAGCSYSDHSGCHAAAITVGGGAGEAQCATFIPLSVKGGLDRVVSHVGACQRVDCTHNDALSCGAEAVRIGAGHDIADCLTFAKA